VLLRWKLFLAIFSMLLLLLVFFPPIVSASPETVVYDPFLNSSGKQIPCDASDGFVEVKEPDDDVAVTNIIIGAEPKGVFIEAPEAYPTWLVPYKVKVTVKNEGQNTESFNVSVLLQNATGNYTKGTQQVNNLAPGATINLTFTFAVPPLPGYPDNAPAAWPYPTYTVWANASVVPGETDTADNELFDGLIKVKWPGDVNNDGHVTLPDLVPFAKSWDGDIVLWPSRYNYKCDFDMNGEIKLGDLVKLAKNWYKGPLDQE